MRPAFAWLRASGASSLRSRRVLGLTDYGIVITNCLHVRRSRQKSQAPAASYLQQVTSVPPGPFELRREALLARVVLARPRILLLLAPAGFGKSTLARQILEGQEGGVICDCEAAGDALGMAAALLQALSASDPANADRERPLEEQLELAVGAWKSAIGVNVLVFERAERCAREPGMRDFLARLLEAAPPQAGIVICTREDLSLHLTRFAAPHEILAMRAEDLAFDRSDLARLFADHPEQAGYLGRIFALSEGWPIAVLLLGRFLNEGRFEMLIDRPNDSAFDGLRDYLADHVIAPLDASLREALFACACIPRATALDLQSERFDPATVPQLIEFSKRSPFLSRSADGAFLLHPLLASALLEERGDERAALLHRAAQKHAEAARFQRAAELHMLRDDPESAARALGSHEVIRDRTPSLGYTRLLSRLELPLVQRYPRLWGVTALMRTFCETPEALLDEAESMWRTLPRETAALERCSVLIVRLLFMGHIGLLSEAESLLKTFAEQNQVGDEPRDFFEGCVFYLFGLLHARMGRTARAERELMLALPMIDNVDVMASGTLLALGADVARTRGEFAVAREFIERALLRARSSGLPNFAAFDLAEAAFGAWLAGEAAALSRFSEELDRTVRANGVHGFAFFAAALLGREEEPRNADLLKWVACGRIVQASRANSPLQAAALARDALEAALQCRSPFIEVLAHTALGLAAPAERARCLQAAEACAQRCDSPALVEAVLALAEGRAHAGMLLAFAARFALVDAGRSAQLRVSVLQGTVRCGDRRIDLPEREFALLTALCLRRETVTRARLAALLWPEMDELAGRNALSVTLHRLRAHLETNAIVRSRDGYALQPGAVVDLWEIERTAALSQRGVLSEGERRAMERAYERLCAQRSPRMLAWPWFEPTERRIGELRLRIGCALADQAMTAGGIDRALGIAKEMIALDACDEVARRIAIEAHLAAGDRPGALREYREYQRTLQAELQCEPSDEIKALLAPRTGVAAQSV